MKPSRLFALFVGVLVAASSLSARQAQDGTQPQRQDNTNKQVRVTITKIGQQNCGPGSGDLPVVRLKVRLEITNLTDKKLIVSKGIGAAFYGMTIAKDEQALAAGTYESNDNTDWFSESNAQPPPANAPPADFTILGPVNRLRRSGFSTCWYSVKPFPYPEDCLSRGFTCFSLI